MSVKIIDIGAIQTDALDIGAIQEEEAAPPVTDIVILRRRRESA